MQSVISTYLYLFLTSTCRAVEKGKALVLKRRMRSQMLDDIFDDSFRLHDSSNVARMLFIFLTGSHITDDDIKTAEDKFAESLHLAQLGMFNLLENDVSELRRRIDDVFVSKMDIACR